MFQSKIFLDQDSSNKTPIGLDKEYYKDDKNNYYWYYKGGGLFPTQSYFKKMSNVDTESFESLSYEKMEDYYCASGFAKDRNHVYLNGNVLEDVDPNTFRFVTDNCYGCFEDEPCFQDKDSIYTIEDGKITWLSSSDL